MAYMMAIYAILIAGGMTTIQVSTAGQNYVNHGILPTAQNTLQPPLPPRDFSAAPAKTPQVKSARGGMSF